jgi:hypothetical protein
MPIWVHVCGCRPQPRLAAGHPTAGELPDEFCPWNAGGSKIGSDRVERPDEAPSLRCDITALGSAYLGGFTWTQLARALRVTELVSGAITLADTVFQTPRAPWCPEIF